MKMGGAGDTFDRCPHLVIVEGDGAGRAFPLTKATTSIGRDPAGDIVLPHATVSWHHAAITVEGEQIVLQDLGSRNGTFVGVARIGRRTLAAGDVIAIGDRAAFKLAFLGPVDDHPTPAVVVPQRPSDPPVANAAALVDRLRKERSAHEPDVSMVLMFVGLPELPADAPSSEHLMRSIVGACREVLDAGDLLARASERELIALVRSTVERAVQIGDRIRAGAPLAPTIVLVPVPFHAALGVEALLLVAARRAAEALRNAPGTIRTVFLHESLH
ncbi:MAG TPA: FHA domain-containing protein [Polyangia bacterium]|jgi:pSer/pThr/pTyr-binding forkhead associated (FHA) protein|nr:FHA domain-containing protein [Polyangia bacterium]